MITLSIFLIFIGLIITAVGGFIFNTYSEKNTNASFNEAKGERKEISSKLDIEFENAKQVITKHRESLESKLENETNTIIDELNIKSKEANLALENLKNQSNIASKAISEEIVDLKLQTEKELERLSYPIPSSLYPTSISINIKPEGFNEAIEEIRTKYGTHDLNAEHLGKDKFAKKGMDLKSDDFDLGLFDNINNKTLTVGMQFGDENGTFGGNKGIYWRFQKQVQLNNQDVHIQYIIDNRKEEREYFNLIIGNNTYSIPQSGRLRLFSGISSAKDLCGQKVYLKIQFDQNQLLMPPIVTFNHLLFKDNYSREYMIEIDGVKTIRHDLSKAREEQKKIKGMATIVSRLPKYWDDTYVVGTLKCISI
ncbi:hypothetical protein [Flagellimonas sp.]|uniref:hypothetical protein n=1 Tax=Flagellimonas sp. TaxID=2058762 RepID=UPI003BAD7D49